MGPMTDQLENQQMSSMSILALALPLFILMTPERFGSSCRFASDGAADMTVGDAAGGALGGNSTVDAP